MATTSSQTDQASRPGSELDGMEKISYAWQERKRSMKHTRIIVTHYGGPDAPRVVEEECPEPKDGEVRVRVLAAGVVLPDIMMREGVHPETPALPIHGVYAEFVCLAQRELVLVPSGLDVAEAVSLILNYITAYQMLHHR